MITEHKVTHRIASVDELKKELEAVIKGNFEFVTLGKVPVAHSNDGKGVFELEVRYAVTHAAEKQFSFLSTP